MGNWKQQENWLAGTDEIQKEGFESLEIKYFPVGCKKEIFTNNNLQLRICINCQIHSGVKIVYDKTILSVFDVNCSVKIVTFQLWQLQEH